jgi:hypothetical protein
MRDDLAAALLLVIEQHRQPSEFSRNINDCSPKARLWEAAGPSRPHHAYHLASPELPEEARIAKPAQRALIGERLGAVPSGVQFVAPTATLFAPSLAAPAEVMLRTRPPDVASHDRGPARRLTRLQILQSGFELRWWRVLRLLQSLCNHRKSDDPNKCQNGSRPICVDDDLRSRPGCLFGYFESPAHQFANDGNPFGGRDLLASRRLSQTRGNRPKATECAANERLPGVISPRLWSDNCRWFLQPIAHRESRDTPKIAVKVLLIPVRGIEPNVRS